MSTYVALGSTLAGYRIEDVIGRGGMGVVYRATQLALDRVVALKVIAPELSADERFRERFKQEAKVAASIDHANVLPVYEADDENGLIFISMRYVGGGDLGALLKKGRLEPVRAGAIVAQVGAALDAAHQLGLVHRDVKPSNVLLETREAREHAYLADFGLTKMSSSVSGITKTGQLVGTIDYASPEQIRGDPVDARSDVYALGCVLFQTLTGVVPYPAEDELAKLWAHMHEAPPSLASVEGRLPRELDAVVQRAMAKESGERFASAGDLGRAALAAAESKALVFPDRSVARGDAATALPALSGARLAGIRRRRFLIPFALLLVIGAIVGALAATGVVSGRSAGEDLAARGTAAEVPNEDGTSAEPSLEAEESVMGKPVALAGTPTDIAIGGGSVWATTREGDLYEIDPKRNEVVGAPARLSIVAGSLVALAYDDKEDVLWLERVDRGLNGSLVRLDPRTKAPLGPEIETGESPTALAISDEFVWVLNGGNPQDRRSKSTLVKVDRRSGQIAGEPVSIGSAGASGLAIGDGAIWIGVYEKHQILRVDPVRAKLVGEPILVDGFPLRLAFANGRVWFTYDGIESLGTIDPKTNEVAGARLPVDGAPFYMSADGERLWVAGSVTNTITVIDPKLKQVVAVVPAPKDPGPITAADGAVWVGSAKSDTATPLKPTAIPLQLARSGVPEAPGSLPFAGRLPAGTYTSGRFEPQFKFTVPAGWVSYIIERDGFSVSLDRRTEPGITVNAVERVFRGNALNLMPAPDDLLAWIRKKPGLSVSEPRPASVGGFEAVQVDVALTQAPKAYPRDCPRPCVFLFPVGDRGAITIELGAAPTRFFLLDVRGKELVVSINTLGSKAELDGFLPEAESVLRSIRFA